MIHLIQTTPENQPDVIASYAYSLYGMKTVLRARLAEPNPLFGFDGELTDPITQWQFLGQGYRAYNPLLHRFMAQDRWSPFAKGGVNGYGFANNNPIAHFDPSGHMSAGLSLGLSIFGLTLALVAGGIAMLPVFGAVPALAEVAASSTVLNVVSSAFDVGSGTFSVAGSAIAFADGADKHRQPIARVLNIISLTMGVVSLATVIGSGLNSAIRGNQTIVANEEDELPLVTNSSTTLSSRNPAINSAPEDYDLLEMSDEEDGDWDMNHNASNEPLIRQRGSSIASSIRSTKFTRFVRTFSKAFPGIASVKLPFKGAHVSSVFVLNTITDISFITLGGIGLHDNNDNN